jgi:hypothetical protein
MLFPAGMSAPTIRLLRSAAPLVEPTVDVRHRLAPWRLPADTEIVDTGNSLKWTGRRSAIAVAFGLFLRGSAMVFAAMNGWITL